MLSRHLSRVFLVCASCAAAAAAPAVGAQGRDGRVAAEDRVALSHAVRDYFRRAEAFGFSGAVLVARGDTILLQEGFGFADRASGIPATANTLFGIASLEKQFVAAAILQLEDERKLRTSDKLSKYFEGLSPPIADVSLEQLLSHTSGIGDYYWDQRPGPIEEYLRFVLGLPLETAPGSTFRYSNANFDLLIAVAEKVGGVPFALFVERALLRPAGMRSTAAASRITDGPTIAKYRYWSGDPGRSADMDTASLLNRAPWWGQVLSSVTELYQWHGALRDGLVLSDSARRKLFTPIRSGYALGWNVGTTARGTGYIYHTGSESNLGGMQAGFFELVDEDLVVIILANSMLGPRLNAIELLSDVEQLVMGGAPMIPPAPWRAPSTAVGQQLAGTYAMAGGGRFRIGMARDGRLVIFPMDRRGRLLLRFPDAQAPDGALTSDSLAAAVILAADSGDFEPLRRHLPETQFASAKGFLEQVLAPDPNFGKLLQVRTIHRRPMLIRGEMRMAAYLQLEYENTYYLLRIDHLPSGKIDLHNVSNPVRMEFPLVQTGPESYSTWDFALGAGLTIAVERSATGDRRLRMRAGRSTATAVLEPAG